MGALKGSLSESARQPVVPPDEITGQDEITASHIFAAGIFGSKMLANMLYTWLELIFFLFAFL